MKYKYKFSVIIPIYNVYDYLEETILSVINQSIGFKKNIQMILVNDGSPDNSEEICLKYKDMYPENIIYIKKENSGVSETRNEGMKYIEGEYVNFLDSDDTWEKDVFKKAYKMFTKNPDIILIGVRQKYFEAQNNYTSLDYKFDKDKIVDVRKDFDHIHLSVTSGFFKSSAIKDIKYDKRIKYSEDAKFIYEFLIKNKSYKYGIISSSIHNYRKRNLGNSAIQTKDLKIDWYKQTVELSYLYLLEKSKKEFIELYKTIQYYVAYDYQWRLNYDFLNINNFSKEEIEDYLNNTKKIFQFIDDEVILEQKHCACIYKQLALKIKYGSYDKAINKFFNKSDDSNLIIELEKISNNKITFEGSLNYIYNDKIKLFYTLDDKTFKEIRLSKNLFKNYKNMLNDDIYSSYFKLSVDFKPSKIKFFVEYEGIKKELKIKCGEWFSLTNHKRSFHNYKKYTMSKKNNYLIIEKRNIISTLIHELKFQISLIKYKKIKSSLFRLFYYISKPFFTKPVWIISDREMVAGDNGEALFKYLSGLNNKNIKVYFAINKNSNDISRLKKYGNVIYFKTLKYYIIFSHCNKIISSHADSYVYNPLGKGGNTIRDLYNYKYIFLQHGIIKHDLSNWLNRFNRNFSIFVTSSLEEYNLITNNAKYGYTKDVVKLTGLARYDYLENKNELSNVIFIAPTWRSSLAGPLMNNSQKRLYNNKFKESEFYKFYNELLNNKHLIEVLKKYKYKIKFCIHPSLKDQIKDFKFYEKYIDFIHNTNYNKEFVSDKLLITDYSSIMFDFAYLKKPIIYNLFDEDIFYKNHIYSKGNYDYEKHGFGACIYDVDSLINEIEKNLKNNCKMEKKYVDRVNSYFKYHDRKNCERIYNEILKLEE